MMMKVVVVGEGEKVAQVPEAIDVSAICDLVFQRRAEAHVGLVLATSTCGRLRCRLYLAFH